MKYLSFPLALLCSAIIFTGCQKEDEPAAPGGNTGGGNTGGGFTPPTTSYWRINGIANNESMDAVSVNIAGNTLGVAKPFSDAGYGYCQLRIFTCDDDRDLRNEVPEGGYIDLPISWNYDTTSDSVKVELDVVDGNANTQGNYFYKAASGVVHVSKSGGKLRFTSDGVLTLSGVKYPNMQDYVYTSQLEFSQVEP